jgi:hypothetical protein
MYFLNNSIVVPPNTRLMGGGEAVTAIYFAEATPKTAPLYYISQNETLAMVSVYPPVGWLY